MSYYAVARGRTPGIYTSWDACKLQTAGYSGAVFKKFKTEAEARAFLSARALPSQPLPSRTVAYGDLAAAESSAAAGDFTAAESSAADGNFASAESSAADGTIVTGTANARASFPSATAPPHQASLSDETAALPEDAALAYVDGSFNIAEGRYGYGVVLLHAGQCLEFSGSGSEPGMALMRNVAGEILGAMRAVEESLALGVRELTICYDYMGIEQWASGGWKCNKPETAAYRDFMRRHRDQLSLHFCKVLAHSGVSGNERADRLAKTAAGLL